MKTLLLRLALMAACTAAMSASAIAQAGQVGAASELNGKRQDLSPPPPAYMQIQATVLVAQATGNQPAPAITVATTLWTGQSVEQDGGSHMTESGKGRLLTPAGEAIFLLTSSGWLERNGITSSEPKATAIVEIAPKYGTLEVLPEGEFRYTPKKGFLGKDFVSFIVDIEGKKVRLNVPLFVVKEIEEPKAQNGIPVYQDPASTSDLTAWPNTSALSAFLASGEGVRAQITLDTTAAGHGWYVDPTPLDNTDDYLPTSNPNVWQAEAGSDAARKMDMVSALLHAYHSALRTEHSSPSQEFMATTRTGGGRRLPGAGKMGLMQNLGATLTPTLSQGERELDSAPTQACLPLRCGLDLASASLPPLKKTTHVTA